jgi:hypothetical protein
MSEAFAYDLADNMLSRTRMPGAYVYPPRHDSNRINPHNYGVHCT